MRNIPRARLLLAACALATAFTCATSALGQSAFTMRSIADGLQEPSGVAIHPVTGEIYVAERASGRIMVIKNGKAEPVVASGWTVSKTLPRWAVSATMPEATWMATTLQKPGPISIATNGSIFVAEQIPNGRLLEFRPNEQGKYDVAHCIPVPWLDQEFMWRDVFVDPDNRLFIAGYDEIGSDFMKFGSSLLREPDGNWWVIDFGPFAQFNTFVLSERLDIMILGDRGKGSLAWWEVDRHMMMGGSQNVSGRSELVSLALYTDGSFILGLQDGPGKASLKRMEPASGLQTTLTEDLKSIGDIEIDRKNVRYLITDPASGRLLEGKIGGDAKFNESIMRQMVRSAEGAAGIQTEAPAFLNNFFDRLQDAAKDILPDGSTHSVDFSLSDIAGKMPVIAGRVRAAVEVDGAEDDPIVSVEFFLLFPSKVVLTESAVSPSLSFFSAKRKSGKVEQTRPVFDGDVGVYRMSGTNFSKIASAPGGIQVPVVVCGLDQAEDGVTVKLAFLGAGIFGDYYLTLFQGPRQQSAKLMVKSPDSATGTVTYEASFMEEATLEGMSGSKITKEEFSNLLISGFDGASKGANRSVGWLKLGQFPASMTLGFGDDTETKLTGAQSDMQAIMDKKRVEMSLISSTGISSAPTATAPAAAATDATAATAAPAVQEAP